MKWRLVTAWLVGLIVATGATWQIVNVADSRVSARPVAVSPTLGDPVPDDLVASSTTIETTPTLETFPTTSLPATNNTSPGATTTSTTAPSPTSTTQQTPPSTQTEWSIHTVNTVGGSVVVRYRPGEVELQAATPAPGYDVDVSKAGPPEVRVEFEAGETEVRVDIEWDHGELKVEVGGP